LSRLLGSQEVAELLGLTREGVRQRRLREDFPAPIQTLACGPIWERSQIVDYARQRSERFDERPAVEALAREPVTFEPSVDRDPYYPTSEAARILGVSVAQLEHVSRAIPSMPRRRNLRTGELVGIPTDGLGTWARFLGRQLVETAA
jgi:hypothetical protein